MFGSDLESVFNGKEIPSDRGETIEDYFG